MSDFANLIGKALNTPPVGIIELKPGERTELKDIDGRLIKPKMLKLDVDTETASLFHILIETFERRGENEGINAVKKVYTVVPNAYSPHIHIGSFYDKPSAIHIPISWSVFITLTTSGQETKVKKAVLEYTFGTPF